MAEIVVDGVTKTFGPVPVLKGVSLTVGDSEFVSLVGPSGCGKTTLMRIIAGLEKPTAGCVVFGAHDVTQVRAADRDVAMVFQNYALYPHLTVQQNLAVPLLMRRLDVVERMPFAHLVRRGLKERLAAIRADTEATAATLGIDHLLARRPAQLSGGQRQRVALGRAIIRQPSVFLMDEPLSNLDAAMRVQMRTEIVGIHRRVGCSTVYVTHDQSEAMTMSDRVAVMMDGEILQVGTPEEIYTDPVDLRVASFVGSPRINVLAALAGDDGEVRIDGAPVAVRTSERGRVSVAVRPEDFSIQRDGIACEVEQVEYLGDCLLVHSRTTKSRSVVIAKLPASDRSRMPAGSAIMLRPDPRKVLLFQGDGRRAPSLEPLRMAAHG